MLLVVGLGNPGKKYAANRHNVGFMVVDELARGARAEAFRGKFSGELARASLGKEEAWLFKPQTYMNLSGDAVQPCAVFHKIEPGSIIVVHDELDVPFGEVRLKLGGGHAGHNGLRSIMQRLGTGDFLRVRIGIGRPAADFRGDVADWVLSDFSAGECAELDHCLQSAMKSVLDIAARGPEAAMKTSNTRPKKSRPPEAPPTG
ncbi:MAG: aminoacyl-tRNA hydrolase [Myxococcales bacterium]|nr:aminoacyl-tRNA hydrolase [Myxococcales bacterium]